MRLLRILAVAVALAASPALAQDSPRAAAHDGFGRMVFDWAGPVIYSAEIAGQSLVVRFNKPVAGDPRAILRPLSGYLRDVAVSPDGKTLSFALNRPVQARAFLVGQSVVVDLIDRPGQPPAAAAPATAPAAAVTPEVKVRGAEHTGFHRVVFEWPRLVEYHVDQNGARASVVFSRPARIDTAALQAALPADAALVESGAADTATTVAFSLPPNARLRHFRSGTGVVLDLVRAPDAAPPKTAEGQPAKVPLAPSPGPLPAEAPAPAPAPLAAAAPQPAPAQQLGAASPAAEPVQVSLTIPWTQPAGAAVFRRAGWLWLVFDRPQPVDLAALRRAAGDMIAHIEQTPHPDATVLRLVTRPDYNPSLRRDGLAWILDFARQPLRPATPIAINRRTEKGETSLFLPVAEGGAVLQLRDPEVGDLLQVIPVVPLGSGVFPGSALPEVELPPTAQGVVVVPLADGLAVTPDRSGIGVAIPGGFSVSPIQPPAAPAPLPQPAAAAGGVLDIPAWLGGGPRRFAEERRQLERRLGEMPRGQRNPGRLDLARLHLANGNAAEVLSILRVMADEEPAVVDAGPYRALRGAAQLLMHRPELAAEDLSHPDIQAVPEVAFWRAAALASRGDPRGQAPALAAGLDLLETYPKRLKLQLGFTAAEAFIAAGDDKSAAAALALLGGERLSRAQQAQLAYLEGAQQQLLGNFAAALEHWQAAQDSDNRLFRVRAALAAAELQLKQQAITPAQVLRRLDRLRFAWRGDDIEFALLKRLAELQIETGDYGEGLRTLRQLASTFGQHRDIGAAAKLMAETFETLFLGGGAESMAPVSAIALFEEFRELTPTGAKGDEMIARLADRMAAVDLLDRAADLLRHQVEYRLHGLDKTRVGTRLAVLYLLDRKPGEALKVLEAGDDAQAAAALKQQRRHLAAQALSDLGRGREAIARLAGDDSVNARLLRAEIEWRDKNWPEAAAAFSSLVAEPLPGRPLDPDSARFVLHWATALTLANDENGVGRLRAAYGPLMARSPYRDAFTLLVSEISAGLPDYRKVDDKIKEAEKFQVFMAAYRQRLQAEGLSALN